MGVESVQSGGRAEGKFPQVRLDNRVKKVYFITRIKKLVVVTTVTTVTHVTVLSIAIRNNLFD